MTGNEITIRVPYADTDQMGMVYYANYLVYFERGRTEWLRQRGFSYRELEKDGYYLPVIECFCKYHSPARYDELIKISTALSSVGSASVEFEYEITEGSRLIATGKTKHPFVNKALKPVRIPADVKKVLTE
ncbi:MAG TPA: acyl-CoA thioesterase [Elusimicrobia bacterium]|nr:MAG: hypothetical protein A2278_06860 [Elusimicrobia bacterium RIFOXYA12_FULL_49_49]OGS07306.1 MAG: hypothetical protein A2204_07835 [Elusimicrobia bacterium RIFOXYA1_FULL_47_7]OGS10961.1 MAG: hypothetical protein A2386_03620 [Elusimicrobia bacterium RIFOXYB1_FULL_48_9]OGS16237.1 MAG: hypothetical protein A2251_01325 [Elusimicrobia bacterium RIFOXYA2_FULL_47_53]OGS26220.1 MAG: hypothetical protein A2339_02770 [Elusimicrobia bacterium RIFOXYB12_FULL_50_12]OGS31392.1 MAG: hypothetical protein